MSARLGLPTLAVTAFALGGLPLSGCAQVDPYTRTGMWQPGGVNARNLAAMVVQPTDLLRGRGSEQAQGVTSTSAVMRLLNGTPTPLPTLSASSAPGSGGTGGGGGAGGGSGAGGAAGGPASTAGIGAN